MQSQSMIYRGSRLAILASIPVLLTACASMDASGPKASAALEPRSGSQVAGTVSFQAVGQKVRVEASVTGLTPGEHGGAERHAGDMPNLVADASGKAMLSAELDMLSLTEGPTGILKRSVVIHADPDDYKSQPAGNSGKRVACGVIRAAGSAY